MTEVFRTPDERFDALPGFELEPAYVELEDADAGTLRLAYLDERPRGAEPGSGSTVVLFHGEPTWSYLYREVIPPLLDAGHRVIAPDYAGFGRSDKPTELGWYSYDRHVDLVGRLLEGLEISAATAVVHDWGGPIGLRLAVERPQMFERMVVMDIGLFTGEQPMTKAWQAFRDFVERTEDLPISMLVKGACARGMDDATAAAYDAPYPTPESKAGARAFPLMIPTSPEMPGADAGRRTLEALREDEREKLVLWADGDPILPFEVGERVARAINAPAPEPVENASHFLQEDAGEEIGERIAAWLGELGVAG